MISESLIKINAIKNAISGAANGVAALMGGCRSGRFGSLSRCAAWRSR